VRRRAFITLRGGAAVAWPLVTRAQVTSRTRRIGVFMALAETDPEARATVAGTRFAGMDCWPKSSDRLPFYCWWRTTATGVRQRPQYPGPALPPPLVPDCLLGAFVLRRCLRGGFGGW